MDTPYIGEIKLVSFATLPSGWAFCNGQELQIAQHTALFSVLGTSYGGNGVSTFCLPYMCGKIGLHASPFIPVGAQGGEAKHALTMAEMPKHNHQGLPAVKTAGVKSTPVNSYPAGTGTTSQYSLSGQGAAWAKMHPAAIATAGTGAPHENMMPYVTLNWIIATSGIVPSR
jgi:microcystin-dependent protein